MQQPTKSGIRNAGRSWNPERALQASVNWAVLGLVIEKPSYGYEIGRRFLTRFADFVPASLSNIYTTLDRLVRLGLIEPTHAQAATVSGRQQKLHYRATSEGARAYRSWLARRLREIDHRSELLLRLLSVCLRGVPALDEVLERYEAECLEEQRRLEARPPERTSEDPELMPELLARMVGDERISMLAAQLDWVRRTRAELSDHLERQRRRAAAMQGRRSEPEG
ncbi:MAG TPA: PadR family transcriptional regulator [Solirubrobacteraceae bacterium]|nr:PadR family transcriptional regulator [Solirubrobacteraceae bacterium]